MIFGRTIEWTRHGIGADPTWFGPGGYFHSADPHTREKLTRKGNELLYEVKAADPDVLAGPWVMALRTLPLSTAPDAGLLCCEVYETGKTSSRIRH